MFVYLLLCSDGSTYIGATVNLEKRLRQHNKEIKGGAVQTGRKVSQGHVWTRACYISEFPDWTATLQFEWRWKQISRKYSSKLVPLERRLLALKKLLSLQQSTSLAVPFSEWNTKPTVHIEFEHDVCKHHLEYESHIEYDILYEN